MAWKISVSSHGMEPEHEEVEGATVGEAVENGLEELGYTDNDEGSLVITITGAANE